VGPSTFADYLTRLRMALRRGSAWVRRHVLLVLFALPLLWIGLYSSRFVRRLLSPRSARMEDGPRHAAGRCYQDLCSALSQVGPGLAREPSVAPLEYLERITPLLLERTPDALGEVEGLTAFLLELRYGRETPTREQLQRATERLDAVRIMLRNDDGAVS